MKPVRIFLIGNLTTALFMAAYYRQKAMKGDEFRDICIVLLDKGVEENDPAVRPFKQIAKLISSEVYFCLGPEREYIHMTLKNIFSDWKRKRGYLKVVKNLFRKGDINWNQIEEIYHGHRIFHQYVKYLNSKVRLIGFEHGFSEIRNMLLGTSKEAKIRNYLKTILGKLFFIFNAYADNDDEVVSLFSSNIKRINNNISVVPLNPEHVIEAADIVTQKDSINGKVLSDESKTAIILLHPLGYFSDDQNDHLEFNKDILNHVIEQLKQLDPDINTIILKGQHGDEYYSKLKSELAEHFKQYHLLVFDDICTMNYSIEFYLNIIRPKVILANTSVGLFYAKLLNPDIKTYTFHPLMMDCLYRHFGKIYPDYPWILDIFYNKHRESFKDVLPEKMFIRKNMLQEERK